MSLASLLASPAPGAFRRPAVRDGILLVAVMAAAIGAAQAWSLLPRTGAEPPGITFDEALLLANLFTLCLVGFGARRVSEDRSRLLWGVIAREEADRATARAWTDGGTGLASRHGFDLACREAAEGGESRTVLVARLRGLSRIEAEHGGQEARQVVAILGRRLRAAVDATDLVARYEDDAFAVLAGDGGSGSAARATGDLVARALAEPVLIGGRRHLVVAAVGATPLAGEPEEAMRRAEHALSASCALGRPAVTFCPPPATTAAA